MKKTYNVVNSIKQKGYPVNTKNYREAHAEADQQEKKKYPKGYKELKKVEKKMKPNTLMGDHTAKGKNKVSKVVPKNLRKEVVSHEVDELKNERRLNKLHGGK